MDKTKNNLIKSKSSNGTTTTSKKQPRRNDKKSRSNAEIKPYALKKRGVYVKKKPTKSSLNDPPDTIGNGFKCRPRPDKKRFVTSVMTILSKTTARTQYPNSNNASLTRHGEQNKLNNNTRDEVVNEFISITKKQKYRSRVLNKIENDMNDIVVLQGKKTMSPSSNTLNSYSELENDEWSDVLPEVEPKVDNNIEDNMFRIAEHDESTVTLVNVEQASYEKKLYSFFVDLLETTFDVYDGNTALHTPLLTSEKSSKVSLEIDEDTAKKLNIVKCKPKSQAVKLYQESKCYFLNSTTCNKSNQGDSNSKSVITIDMSNGKRKSKTKTFDYKKKNSRVTQKHKQKPYPWNLKSLQREQKRNLMKLLKQELRKEKRREPQNFFQALKLMAKNKEQNETTTNTNESKKKDNDDDNFKCRFKRRRLLSRMSKKPNIMSPLSTRKSLR